VCSTMSRTSLTGIMMCLRLPLQATPAEPTLNVMAALNKRFRPRFGVFRLSGLSLMFGISPALKIALRLGLESNPSWRGFLSRSSGNSFARSMSGPRRKVQISAIMQGVKETHKLAAT
jgi:hypothetical protein